MKNPFLSRIASRGQGHHGRVAEKKTAIRLGGKLQPGSGAVDGAKGDMKVDTPSIPFLLENKSTTAASISITQDWLLKVYQEALEQQRHPALSFQFTTASGTSDRRNRWVAIPEYVFQQLIEKE